MENRKQLIINVILTILYAVFTLIIVLHHEIWADEAQAWLVVRDLDIYGVIEHVRTEGHPLLWYFILFPLAKINLPVVSMQIINWLFVILAVSVFIWKSPFNTFCKISVLCSSAFLYWFPAIARSYCLIPFLLFLIAYLYKKQEKHPYLYAIILALLANVHVIMFAFCTVLFLIFLYSNRNRKYFLPSAIIFFALCALVIYLHGTQNENIIVKNSLDINLSLMHLKNIYQKIIYSIYGSTNIVYSIIFFVFLWISISISFFSNKKVLLAEIAHTLFQIFIILFIYHTVMPQRTYSVLLVFLCGLWIIMDNLQNEKIKGLVNIVVSVAFISSFFASLSLVFNDLVYSFSDGKNTADFVKNTIPKNAIIVSNYPITTTSINAYLPKNIKFYYDGYEDFYTFTEWNKTFPDISTPVPINKILKKYKTIYIILSAGNYFEDLKPIYASKNNVITLQEKFYIYKLEDKQ